MGMLVNSFTAAGSSSFTATITIAAGKTASNLTDYPVYVNLADMPAGFWSGVASDGSNILVKQSGSDIPFDVVKIDTGGQTGSLFFKASSLLTASANVFTLDLTGLSMPAVGAANGRNAVWSAFDWVWLAASVSAGAPEAVDRTGGAAATTNNGTFTNSPISLGAGCGVQNTSGVPSLKWLARPSHTVFTFAGTMRLDVASISATRTAFMYSTSSATRVGMGARDNGSSDAYNVWDNSNSWQAGSPPLISANNGVAKRLHSVYNGSTSRIRYVDGVADNTSGAITARPNTDVDYTIGNVPGGTEPFTAGYMAFFYLRPAILSADYIAAEYSNLNAPSSFYAIT